MTAGVSRRFELWIASFVIDFCVLFGKMYEINPSLILHPKVSQKTPTVTRCEVLKEASMDIQF
jgi:hypothetical protein